MEGRLLWNLKVQKLSIKRNHTQRVGWIEIYFSSREVHLITRPTFIFIGERRNCKLKNLFFLSYRVARVIMGEKLKGRASEAKKVQVRILPLAIGTNESNKNRYQQIIAIIIMEKLKEEDFKGRIANLEKIVELLQSQIDILINLARKDGDKQKVYNV